VTEKTLQNVNSPVYNKLNDVILEKELKDSKAEIKELKKEIAWLKCCLVNNSVVEFPDRITNKKDC